MRCERGFFRMWGVCVYCLRQRQIRTRKRVRRRKTRVLHYAQLDIMDHFPTNWGRPVSLESPIPRFMLKPRMFS